MQRTEAGRISNEWISQRGRRVALAGTVARGGGFWEGCFLQNLSQNGWLCLEMHIRTLVHAQFLIKVETCPVI